MAKYSNVFNQRIGKIPEYIVSLKLRPNVKPSYTRERPLPYALRQPVEKELDDLEVSGVITRIDSSDWGSPLVVIPKPRGGVRLCVDYKTGVNERLIAANYPIRPIPEVLHELRNSKYFCKLDIYKAYLHLAVDEESAKIQTITTHIGTYQMNRLSFGIKTAPAEFNRIIDQILKGLPKVVAYFDDLIVHGETVEECMKNLELLLQRLQKYDLHLNKDKCIFFQESIEYLGHIISFNSIAKSPKKVEAILGIPRPKNVDDVRRFLGMATFYARFTPHLSSKSAPLRKLLQKHQKFFWTAECEAAFLKIKTELSSDQVLMPYDPSKPVSLSCDASPYGLGAVLNHIINDVEVPIAFASRSLTVTERNYSQLDLEALAIVFGVTHFYSYLLGRHFTLVSDNLPVTHIFNPKKPIPTMTSARLLRYAALLSTFNFSIQYKKGKDNVVADCFSRAPLPTPAHTVDVFLSHECSDFFDNSISTITTSEITAASIAADTENDPELSKLKKQLLTDNNADPAYTLEKGVIFKNDRVVIPTNFRTSILNELHSTHSGITKMKQLARRYVTWTGIDKDIEMLVRSCSTCAELQRDPPKQISHPWEQPSANWERVHIDFASLNGLDFLLIIDAKSKWLEVRIFRHPPTSGTTIKALQTIFAQHGYPPTLVSDNATLFTSSEFSNFCRTHGIFQKLIAPGYPATNGQVERLVQTLKKKLKATLNDPGDISDKLDYILLQYRATPLACGQSPAELYLNRKIRIRLDAVKPNRLATNTSAPYVTRSFSEGEKVQVRIYSKKKWTLGTVIKRYGSKHYLVQLENSYQLKRHIDQLRSTNCKPQTKVQPSEGTNSKYNQHVSFDVPNLCGEDTYDQPRENFQPDLQQLPTQLQEDVQPDLQWQDFRNRHQRVRRPPAYLRDYQLY